MKKVLIKCGGSTLDELSADFFESLHELKSQGYAIIIVHGGGPDINEMLEKLKIKPEYANGLRKTNEETMHVVEMVLSGKTNRKLVQKLSANGLKAIGISGSDSGLLIGDYIDKKKLGYVGNIQKVNTSIIEMFLKKDIIPVITPIAATATGEKLNVNADYAAAAVGHALKVEHCIFVTDVDGIIIEGKLRKKLTLNELEKFIEQGEIYGGMVPKVQSAAAALEKGVDSVTIVSGMKKFLKNNEWLGTKIIGKEKVWA